MIIKSNRRNIFSAENPEDEEFNQDDFSDSFDSFNDNIDDLSDQIDELQDSIDDIEPDSPNIELDNNIANHYIAECDLCQGVFISAMVESDQAVESISGICPLCEKQSEQYLKWIIKDVADA